MSVLLCAGEVCEGRAGGVANLVFTAHLPYLWFTRKTKSLESKQICSQKVLKIHMILFVTEPAASLSSQGFIFRRPQNEKSCTGENVHRALRRVRDTQVLRKYFSWNTLGTSYPITCSTLLSEVLWKISPFIPVFIA